MSSIRLQHYDVTSCKQRHLIVKHHCCKGVSIFYKHRKFQKVSFINEGVIAFSKKVHVFLRHPVYPRIRPLVELGGQKLSQPLFKVLQLSFYAPEGTSGGILKSHRLSVRTSVRTSVTNHVSAISHKLLKQI